MTASPRRRRSTRRRKNFFQKHWKTLLILVVLAVLIVLIATTDVFGQLSNAISNISNGTNTDNGKSNVSSVPSDTRVATLDGKNLSIFESQEAAESSKISVEAGKKSLSFSTSEHVSVSAYIGGRSVDILSNNGSDSYTLDLTNVADKSIVIIKVTVGGDGSIVSQRLGTADSKTHFVAFEVSNPNMSVEEAAQTSGIPNGKVYFADSVYQTYGSEIEAQQAVKGKQGQFTIPTYMVQDGLQLRAEPSENTARIRIKVCMVGIRGVSSNSICISQETNWAGTLDISGYAGYQMTLMLHAEDGWGINNGFSYVSFFVPEIIQEDPVEQDDEEGFG